MRLSSVGMMCFLLTSGFSQEAPIPKGVSGPVPATAPRQFPQSDTIGGIIVDDQGAPVEGAEIEVKVSRTRDKFATSALPPGYKNPGPVKTDAAGRWRIPGVPAGVLPETPKNNGDGKDTYRFYITHPDFLFLECSSMGPLFGEDVNFRLQSAKLVLKRGHLLHGVVRDAEGKGIAGATIQRNYGALSREDPAATTDAEGRYELKAARPGDLMVRVRAKGFALHQQRVGVHEDLTQDFALQPAQKLILKLRDETNGPVTTGYVNFYPAKRTGADGERLAWAKPDKDGLVVWDEAPAEPITADVVVEDLVPLSKKVTAGPEIMVTLQPKQALPTITLHVTQSGSGVSLVGCTVTTGFFRPDSRFPRSITWLQPETGEPMKPSVAAGDYVGRIKENYQAYMLVFCVRREGHAPVITSPVDPKKGDTTVAVTLEERQAAPITVLTATGAPAAKAQVNIIWQDRSLTLTDFEVRRGRSRNEFMEFSELTSDDGQCTLPVCANDASVLVVHETGFATASYADLVKAGEINLQPYGRVEATVKKDGKPAPGAKFEYQGSMSLPGERYVMLTLNSVSDAEGRIVLPRVLPSTQAHLSEELPAVREGGSRTIVPAVEYKPTVSGETTTFELQAKSSAVRGVTGQFVISDGSPVKVTREERLSVWLMHADPNSQGIPAMGTVGIDGRFHFDAVPPGKYELILPTSDDKPNRYAFSGARTRKVTVPPADPAQPGKTFNLGPIELVDRDQQAVLQAPDGKALFRIRVRSPEGKPIPNATVTFVAARLESNRGASFDMSALGDPKYLQPAHGNADGLVEIITPAKSVDGSAVYAMQTSVSAEGYVATYAAHAEANRESIITLDAAADVALQVLRGGEPLLDERVLILASTESPDSEPVFAPDAATKSHVTHTVRPGKRLFQAAFHAEDGSYLFAPVVDADLAPGVMTRLTAPLQPGIRVAGKVDDQVPRPIREARIEVYVTPALGEAAARFTWSDWQPLHEDGTFEFASLPPGLASFQVIADGWISPVKPDGARRNRPWSTGAITASRADLVIPMERTASCEVTVLDAHGNPVSGAMVAASPNFSPDGVGNRLLTIGLFSLEDRFSRKKLDRASYMAGMEAMQKRYQSITDGQGRAVVHGLPVQSTWESVSAYPPGTDRAKSTKETKRQHLDSLKPGETTKVVLRLEEL